jgi:hypothetical protein
MATGTPIQQTIPVIPATTSQPPRSKTMLHAKIATGGLKAVEDVKDIRATLSELEAEFKSLHEIIESKLHKRFRDIVQPVRVADDTLQINEDGMIPEIPYDVTWEGDRYQIVKGLDGAVRIFEVISA